MIGFIIGIFVGAGIGVGICALVLVASDDEKQHIDDARHPDVPWRWDAWK